MFFILLNFCFVDALYVRSRKAFSKKVPFTFLNVRIVEEKKGKEKENRNFFFTKFPLLAKRNVQACTVLILQRWDFFVTALPMLYSCINRRYVPRIICVLFERELQEQMCEKIRSMQNI